MSGRATSEHAKGLRAEALGLVLCAAGFLEGSWGALIQYLPLEGLGALLVVIGAFLVAHANGVYARSRGEVKAASARRPVDSAPKRI